MDRCSMPGSKCMANKVGSNKTQVDVVEQLTEEPKVRIAVAIAALIHSENYLYKQ